MRLQLIAGLVLVTVGGCAGRPYKAAQVTGRVTLDGKPLSKAHVTFVPMESKENKAPGPTAYGATDADGRYTLAIDPQTPGAVVGRCRVYISTLLMDQPDDDRDAGRKVKAMRDRVPLKYNQKTELVVDVPSGGFEKNFELTSQ